MQPHGALKQRLVHAFANRAQFVGQEASAGHKLDVPVLDFGKMYLLGLPGESYVEYQLLAQNLRRDRRTYQFERSSTYPEMSRPARCVSYSSMAASTSSTRR